MAIKADLSVSEIDARLNELEKRIQLMRSVYERYFAGVDRRPPTQQRHDLVRVVHELEHKVFINNTAQKFRLRSIIQSYNTYRIYWDRVLREIEEEVGYRPRAYRPLIVFSGYYAEFHVYLAEVTPPLKELVLGEGQGFGFFSREEAARWTPASLSPALERACREVLAQGVPRVLSAIAFPTQARAAKPYEPLLYLARAGVVGVLLAPIGASGQALDERSLLGQLALVEDVAQAEQARRLVLDLGHELRTPLNAIMGYSELMLEEGLQDGAALEADLLAGRKRGMQIETGQFRPGLACAAVPVISEGDLADLAVVGAAVPMRDFMQSAKEVRAKLQVTARQLTRVLTGPEEADGAEPAGQAA